MRKGFFTSVLFIILLIGCSNDTYHNAIEKGLDYIASEEYDKAEVAFALALEEKKDDKATALLSQVENYQESFTALEDGDLELSRDLAEKVTSETDGSEALVIKAEELLSSIGELLTTRTALTDEYDKAMKLFEKEKYDAANKAVNKLLKQDASHPSLKSIHQDVEILQSDIEVAIKKEEQALADKEVAEGAAVKKEAESNKRMSAEEALAIIKNLTDWASDYVFELDSTPYDWEGKAYYGIYVYSTIDDSNASKISYAVDAITGEIYDNSRGEMLLVN